MHENNEMTYKCGQTLLQCKCTVVNCTLLLICDQS